MAASNRWKYDVFVSFRGEDIRKSFMDHLFKDFKQKGIQAFRDDKELSKGEVISPELYKAIEQSRFLIVIFSKNYASSSWCMRELVKILECKEMRESEQEVHIIFYDVKPDVVRKQSKSYAEAFAKHEVSNKREVTKWKETLSKAANMSGWDLQDLENGYEAKFIDSISKEILKKLCVGLDVGENIVGLDAHLKKLNLLRFTGSDEVHMIGICGISGIGKTTLAKAIYNLLYVHFEGSCFCDDVQGVSKREGLTRVQMQLIDDILKTRAVDISSVGQGITVIKNVLSSKPILLVLDDVDHWKQLEALAGSRDWFSRGSLIIITGKDKQVLNSHRVDEIYDIDFLDEYESMNLFSSYAFSEKYPTRGFEELAEKVVKYVQGHPLTLKVLGCFLYGKSVGEWDSELERLKLYPNDEIQQVLRLSYDGLNILQQKILLDIAFSFIGMKRDLAASVLDSCGFFAETNMRVLVDKSLITISQYDTSLQMHELIQSMAREIVREKSEIPGNRSRLCGPSEEVYHVLSENKATQAVEVIDLWKKESNQKFDINGKAFAVMKDLRILKLPNDPNVKFSGKLEYLSKSLRYLCWHGCPFKFFPSDFYPENIVVIDLSYSHIKNLWATPKCFTRLKILKLSHCYNLTITPDFTEISNLEELILEGCVSLVEFHPSIGMLKRLVVLNLSGCLKVDHVPYTLGRIKTLLELHIDRTAITRLPSFVFSSIKRLVSSFGQHQRFWSRWWTTISQPSYLPRSLVSSFLESSRSLHTLNLSHCRLLQVLENIGGLSCLEELDLSGNRFTSLPGSLSQLSRLKTLRIHRCKKLEVFPELPPSIVHLHASLCNILEMPETIEGLSCLEELDLSGNPFSSFRGSLRQLSNLRRLYIIGCMNLEMLPELPPRIATIEASKCNISQVHENIGRLSHLEELRLSLNSFTTLSRSLSQLSRIQFLMIDPCPNLEVFPDLPPSISHVNANNCHILRMLENIGHLTRLSYLSALVISHCEKLEVFPELPPSIENLYASDCSILQVPENVGVLSRLKYIRLSGNGFTSLPGNLSRLSRLEMLELDGCTNLKALPELPPSIQRIKASYCTSLRELGNLDRTRVECNFSNCPNLQETVSVSGNLSRLPRPERLELIGCTKLKALPELPPSIQRIDASDCTSLRELGNLDRTRVECNFSNCPNLQETIDMAQSAQ